MYHEYFGFFTSPFSLSPHLQFLFRSSAFQETMAHLVYGLEGGEDIILITGEIGTGKTLALYNLTQHVSRTYQTALINVTQLDFRELLKLLMTDLEVVVPAPADRADLLSALKAELVAIMRRGQRLLLIIDEAQNLDDATLEGVRLLTNLGPPEQQALQVVLSGQPGLRTKINSPHLAQVRQRIRVHYHLEKLGYKETSEYISHRVKVAGCERNLFHKDAIDRIHELSSGIPRLVNVLADRALLAVYVSGDHMVGLEHVEMDETLAKSSPEESISAAIAAQSSESPPESPSEQVSKSELASPPIPEPEPEPEPELEPEPEPETETESDPIPEPIDEPPSAQEELDEITEAALAASAAAPAGKLEAPADEKSEAASETVMAGSNGGDEPPIATKRSPSRARRVLMAALAIVVVSVVAMAYLAHRQGLIELPFLPSSGEVTGTDYVLANVDQTADAVPADSTGVSATVSGDSVVVVVADEPPAGGGVADRPATIPDLGRDAQPVEDVEPPVRDLPPVPEGFYVHVSSFRDLSRADVFATECAAHALPPRIRDVIIEGQRWYRVYVGPYGHEAAAQEAAASVKEQKLSSWTMIVGLR